MPSVMRSLRWVVFVAALLGIMGGVKLLDESSPSGRWILFGLLLVFSIALVQWQKRQVKAMIEKAEEAAQLRPTQRRIRMIGSSAMIARVLDRLHEQHLRQASPESEPLRATLRVMANEGLHASMSFAASRSTWAGVLFNVGVVMGLVAIVYWVDSKVFVEVGSSFSTIALVLTLVLFPWQTNIFIRRVVTLSHGALVRTDEVRTLASRLLGAALANRLFAPPFAPICVDLRSSPVTIDLRNGWAQMDGVCATTRLTATLVAGNAFVRRREPEELMWAQLLHAARHSPVASAGENAIAS